MSKNLITIVFSIFFFITYSGIYLIPQFGIRSDHIVIYPLFVLICVYFFLLNRSLQVNDSILYLISFLIIINIVGLIATFSYQNSISIYEILADIENYLQPIVLIIVASYFAINLKKISLDEQITIISKIFTIFISLNAVFSIFLLYVGPNEYLYLIGGLPDDEGYNVAERALYAHRSGGVFSQPIDAGIAYSIGMIVWLYLFDTNKISIKERPLYVVQFLLMIVGGFVSGSKVAYVLGWGLSLLYIFFLSNIYLKLLGRVKILLTIIFFILLIYVAIQFWDGVGNLWRNYYYFIYYKIFEGLS